MATTHFLDLPKEYANMDIPKKFQNSFGSKKVTKVLTFVDHFEVTNSDYDDLMAIKPGQQNGESKENYLLRRELQNDLQEYKHLFYNYNVDMSKAQIRKLKKKQSKKLQEVN